MQVVLSIGGSSVVPDGKPNMRFLKMLAGIVAGSRHTFGIVVGGGPPARAYAASVRGLGKGEFDADQIAVMCTKTNAKLVAAAMGKLAPDDVIDTFEEARQTAKTHKAVVMGGTIPGITTDTDAVLLAEATMAKRLVNVSNVEAVYDSDPQKNKNAKRYDKLTFEELNRLAAGSDKRMAGTNFVFDLLACRLLARSGIEAHFVSWKNSDDIKNAIEGRKHNGTVVRG